MTRPRYGFEKEQKSSDRPRRTTATFRVAAGDGEAKPRPSVGFGFARRRRGPQPPPLDETVDGAEARGDDGASAGGAEDERSSEDQRRESAYERFSHGSREETRGPLERDLTDYHYMILGLKRETATPAMIREAYRRAVISNHPDKNPHDPFALERFKVIQEVYEILQRRISGAK